MPNKLLKYMFKFFGDIGTGLTVAILLGLVGLSALISFLTNTLDYVIQILTLPTPLWGTIVLALLCYMYFHIKYKIFLSRKTLGNAEADKINIDDYDQPKELFGVSKCKKTGKLYCTSCLIKNIKSPVTEEEYCWRCLLRSCNRCYWNQKYKDLNKKKSRVIHPGVTIDDI